MEKHRLYHNLYISAQILWVITLWISVTFVPSISFMLWVLILVEFLIRKERNKYIPAELVMYYNRKDMQISAINLSSILLSAMLLMLVSNKIIPIYLALSIVISSIISLIICLIIFRNKEN